MASQWLYDYFAAIIAERRTEPRDDVISVLTQAELDGQRLTDEEIIAFLRLLLPAGAETTYRSSSNLMFGLLSQPAISSPRCATTARSCRRRSRKACAGSRRSPASGAPRSRDVEVGGVVIPAGATGRRSSMGARQPRSGRAGTDPDEFDIFRDPQQHMAFAFGPHMCLGMHLARMETTVAINAVLDRLPNARLDPAAEDVHISGLVFRAPSTLPVLFDA